MRDTFETSGDVRDVDLLAAFVAFWRDRVTGAVSFSRGGASAAFQITEGAVVGVSSTESRFDSSAILVRAGKLDASALERLSVPEGTDGALAALQAGILTRREWRWGEKIRAIEILADLLGWSDGKYYFDAEARPETGEFTLTIPRLILELFLRSRDRNLVDHQLGRSDAPIVRAPEFEREFSTFGLTADAESVVRLIDGHATADEIARSAPADDFAVRKLLAALATLGLVRVEAQPEARPVARPGEPGRELDFPAVLEVVTDPPGAEPEEGVEATDGESRGGASGGAVEADDSAAGEPDEAMEQPAWEMPELRRPSRSGSTGFTPRDGTPSGAERTPGFELDPPGSVSRLEAYPLPSADSEGEEAVSSAVSGVDDFAGPPLARPELSAGGAPFEPLTASSVLDPTEPRPPRRTGMGRLLLGVLGGLAVLVAAVLFFRSRSTTSPAAPPAAGATAALAPTSAPTEVVVPSPVPTAAPVAVAPPAVAATRPAASRPLAPTSRPAAPASRPPAPTPRPVPTRAPAPAPAPAASTAAPTASGSRGEWLTRAARDKKRLAAEPSVRYAIQLELACEVPSLAEAWKHDRPAGSMWLLTTRHGARDCFRVLWGRYPSLDAAKAAKASAPAFFSTGANRPAVVSVR